MLYFQDICMKEILDTAKTHIFLGHFAHIPEINGKMNNKLFVIHFFNRHYIHPQDYIDLKRFNSPPLLQKTYIRYHCRNMTFLSSIIGLSGLENIIFLTFTACMC